jgi:hypothetical protein
MATADEGGPGPGPPCHPQDFEARAKIGLTSASYTKGVREQPMPRVGLLLIGCGLALR